MTANLEVIEIEKVKAAGKGPRGGKNAVDYRITKTCVEPSDPIDAKTVELFFEKLGPLACDKSEVSACSSVLLSDLNKAAFGHMGSYTTDVAEWKELVRKKARARRFFIDRKKFYGDKLKNYLLVCILISGLSFAALNWTSSDSDSLVQFVVSSGSMFTAVMLLIQASMRMPKLSNNAIENRAKMDALRRWLLDFTKLDEAVPQDVVLWDRLLVMAVVLGVSEQVMQRLVVVAPNVVDDPDFLPTFVWCGAGSGAPAPATSMGTGLNAAFSATSSSSGSGGGFSSGGGGGAF